VPAKSPEQLADAAGKLIDNHLVRIRLARQGHSNIRKFTWDAATDTFEGVLDRSCKTRLTPTESALCQIPGTKLPHS
jgi:hypothetical protein